MAKHVHYDAWGDTLNQKQRRARMPQVVKSALFKYHQFVLRGMSPAAQEAGLSKDAFLNLFEQYIKVPVRLDPGMLRKAWWV